MRLSKEKSQSIIEYSVIIILVILGIILARPYVIRAINAHMKSWEDGVDDSMNDRFEETTPPALPICGNTFCETGETLENCCADCHGNPPCPDTFCCDAAHHGTETTGTCPADCPPCDNDGTCEPANGENFSNCPADCPPCDNDGTCEAANGEDISNCPGDCCSELCGNGICNAGPPCWETTGTCEVDCPDTTLPCNPPNGECDAGENTTNCCVDCKVCGDHACSSCENCYTCFGDCPCCGNGICDWGPPQNETNATCGTDCRCINTNTTCNPTGWYHGLKCCLQNGTDADGACCKCPGETIYTCHIWPPGNPPCPECSGMGGP